MIRIVEDLPSRSSRLQVALHFVPRSLMKSAGPAGTRLTNHCEPPAPVASRTNF
jgi:hypothetical protein